MPILSLFPFLYVCEKLDCIMKDYISWQSFYIIGIKTKEI